MRVAPGQLRNVVIVVGASLITIGLWVVWLFGASHDDLARIDARVTSLTSESVCIEPELPEDREDYGGCFAVDQALPSELAVGSCISVRVPWRDDESSAGVASGIRATDAAHCEDG